MGWDAMSRQHHLNRHSTAAPHDPRGPRSLSPLSPLACTRAWSSAGLVCAVFSAICKCCRKKHVKKRERFWMNVWSCCEPLLNATAMSAKIGIQPRLKLTRRELESQSGAGRKFGSPQLLRGVWWGVILLESMRCVLVRHRAALTHLGYDHRRRLPANTNRDGGCHLGEQRLEMAIIRGTNLPRQRLIDRADVERADLREAREHLEAGRSNGTWGGWWREHGVGGGRATGRRLRSL